MIGNGENEAAAQEMYLGGDVADGSIHGWVWIWEVDNWCDLKLVKRID
jgi:hypothetical protein